MTPAMLPFVLCLLADPSSWRLLRAVYALEGTALPGHHAFVCWDERESGLIGATFSASGKPRCQLRGRMVDGLPEFTGCESLRGRARGPRGAVGSQGTFSILSGGMYGDE